MTRREFITLLGGAAAAWPVAARAQQSRKLPTIGVLASGTSAVQGPWWAGFAERLHVLGWSQGRTVAIEYRWAENRPERFREIAAEFVRLNVDVIATSGTAAAAAAKQATSVIPIVFALAGEPVGTGLVASLARPGGNATGLSLQVTDLGGKRLELLREVVPALRRLAILVNINNPATVLDMSETEVAARTVGLEVVRLDIRRSEDIGPAVDALKGSAEALYVPSDPLMNGNRVRINTLALGARLPTVCGLREFVEVGMLMSYGPSYPDLFRRAADFVDKILRGANPGGIPVEQPTKFDFVINLSTAKALGLEVPADAARPRRRGDRVMCFTKDGEVTLAFPGHGEASVGLQLNFESLRQKASAVVSTNRIADLDDLLRREEPTEFSEGRIIDVAAIGHLFDVAEQGTLLVIEEHRSPPVREFSYLFVAVTAHFHQRCVLV